MVETSLELVSKSPRCFICGKLYIDQNQHLQKNHSDLFSDLLWIHYLKAIDKMCRGVI